MGDRHQSERVIDFVGIRKKTARYAIRPRLATERLEELPDGRVPDRLRKHRSDGSAGIVYEPLELLERLVALVPPPGFHRV